jgi:hypothetical protein
VRVLDRATGVFIAFGARLALESRARERDRPHASTASAAGRSKVEQVVLHAYFGELATGAVA